jgi:hypothetical protein
MAKILSAKKLLQPNEGKPYLNILPKKKTSIIDLKKGDDPEVTHKLRQDWNDFLVFLDKKNYEVTQY